MPATESVSSCAGGSKSCWLRFPCVSSRRNNDKSLDRHSRMLVLLRDPSHHIASFTGSCIHEEECHCSSARHTECVAYLLAHGADVYAQSSRGDNALHIAAKNGNAGALHALLGFRPHADGEDGSQLLGDIVVQGDAGPTRFIDLHNGKLCCRHAIGKLCRILKFFDPHRGVVKSHC